MLTETGIVRSDITSSFGTASGVAEGVPLTVRLKVYDLNGERGHRAAPAPRSTSGTATGTGSTRSTSEDVASENYLRGVQEAGADGSLEFTSIFPAAYDGRWPHIHFEVYQSLDDATNATNKLRTSPAGAARGRLQRRSTRPTGYEASVGNLASTSLSSDMVFSDGYSLQMATRHRQCRRGLRGHAQHPRLRRRGRVGGWAGALRPARR